LCLYFDSDEIKYLYLAESRERKVARTRKTRCARDVEVARLEGSSCSIMSLQQRKGSSLSKDCLGVVTFPVYRLGAYPGVDRRSTVDVEPLQ
jgi:hypothetical protein